MLNTVAIDAEIKNPNSMPNTHILFPHQLFETLSSIKPHDQVYLIEEPLFFCQVPFHKQKLIYHRASMKFYESYLVSHHIDVHYIEYHQPIASIQFLIPHLAQRGIDHIHLIEPSDDWLYTRSTQAAVTYNVSILWHPNPQFLNHIDQLNDYFAQNPYYQTSFYIHQRKTRNILIDSSLKPIGGKWSYDAENRKKYPKTKTPPSVHRPLINPFVQEAIRYISKHFSQHTGDIPTHTFYPSTFQESKQFLQAFLQERLPEFGAYEDAIVAHIPYLHHSVLTPMLNTGLLTPQYILEQTIQAAQQHSVPLASLEGFIRQLIGWREYIRAVYLHHGRTERCSNHWQFNRKIPPSFYQGNTGIAPLDDAIHKLKQYAYNHHIERLMIIGNFMLLCEFHPQQVYRWFMIHYIDAYDWVMVPNIYGMSQFADGGIMSTKPYLSGSNYILKMSHYTKAPWCAIWDALFWRFLHVHRHYFDSNIRMKMLLSTWDKKDDHHKNNILRIANNYLATLDQELQNQ